MASTTAPPPALVTVRWRLGTTPGKLRVAAVVLVLAALVVLIVAASAAQSRRHAASTLAATSEPQLVQAERLYAALSDADATATTTFLTGSRETTALRQRYVGDVATASALLTGLARHTDAGPQRRAALALAGQLPVYAGLIEAARANNREGFPVGAAYLRRASALMRDTMLAAAEDLYVVEARRTNDEYKTGTRNGGLIAFVIAVAALAILLALAQIGVARFSHRILNLALVIASVLVVVLAVWVIAGLVSEQDALASAQRKGSDSVQELSAARDLILRAQRDDSLALVARGGDATSLADFESVMVALRGAGPRPGGVLAQAENVGRRSGTAAQVRRLRPTLARFEAAHRRVLARERQGHFNAAAGIYAAAEVPLADTLNRGLQDQTTAAQHRFVSEAASATSAVSGVIWAIVLITLAVAALAVFGLAQRIREYR